VAGAIAGLKGRRGGVEDGISRKEALAQFSAEHERTRGEVREILDGMREQATAHERQVEQLIELVRAEGTAQRATIHAVAKAIEGRLERQSEAVGKVGAQVEEMLTRGPRMTGSGR
jgi:hypothetical protein